MEEKKTYETFRNFKVMTYHFAKEKRLPGLIYYFVKMMP